MTGLAKSLFKAHKKIRHDYLGCFASSSVVRSSRMSPRPLHMTTSISQFMRTALAAFVCALGLLLATGGFAAEAKKAFDIPAGEALTSLKQFAAQSGEQLLYSAEAVQGVSTRAVKGTLAPREALDQMVSGTKLTVVADRKNGALSLVRAPSPNAARVAQAPPSIVKEEAKDAVVIIPPFEISEDPDRGYLATNSIGGSRLAIPIEDIPLSIQIVTDRMIQDMAALKIEDSLRFVSGVTLAGRNDSEVGGEGFNVRGFRTLLMLRNGIPFNAFTNTINTLQVEVVKGPSSVLYGVADPGGLVNVVTKRPQKKASYMIAGTVGSWDHYRTDIDFNIPITADGKLAMRLMGTYDTTKDFRPFVDDTTKFLDGVVSYKPNKNHTFLFEWVQGTQNSVASTRRVIPILASGQRLFVPVPRDWPVGGPNDFQHLEQRYLEGTWEAKLASFLVARSVYSMTLHDNDKFSAANGVVTGAGLLAKLPQREHYIYEGKNLYIDLLATYKIGSTNHQTLIGVQDRTRDDEFYNYLRGAAYGGATIPGFVYLDPTVPYNVRWYMPPLSQMEALVGFNPQVSSTRSTGIFLSHQMSMFNDRLRFTAGIRHEKLKVRNISNDTPQFGVIYKITPGLRVFTSYNESFVPNTVIDNNTGNYFEPEKGKGMDVGVKLELLDRKVVGTVSYFDITKNNIVYFLGSTGVPPNAIYEYTSSGEQKSKGFEVDLSITPVKGFQAIVAYAHHDSFETVNYQFPLFVPYRLQGSSPQQYSTWIRWDVPENVLKGLSFGGGYEYRKGPINLFPNSPNRANVQQSYATADLFARYTTKIAGKDVVFSLNVRNITDETYMDKDSWYADPRNYTFTTRIKF